MSDSSKILVVLAVFVAVNLAILFGAVPNAAWIYSADGQTWLDPALGLVKHGAYVKPNAPSTPEIFRVPGYPAFLAGTVLLGGQRFFDVAVPLQIMLLFATGLIAYRITEDWLPGYGLAALVLTAFNPNSVGTAHIIQSETLYGLGIALLGWAVLAYCRRPSIGRAGLAGLALGASCMIRPEAQFLIALLPLGLIILSAMPGPKIGWGRRLAAALVCLVVAAAVVAPWAYRNARLGHGYRLATAASASHYIWDSVGQLEMMAHGVSPTTANNRLATRRAAYIKAYGPDWQKLSANRRDELLFYEGMRAIFSYPSRAIGRTVLYATLQFFGGGGAGNFLNILGYAKSNPIEVMTKHGHSSYLAAWRDALGGSAWPAAAITLTAFAFVVVLRLLGLAGIVTLMRRREWRLLAVILGAMAYFALVIPFYGISRFRVPIEFLFVLLALAGVDGLRARRPAPAHASVPLKI